MSQLVVFALCLLPMCFAWVPVGKIMPKKSFECETTRLRSVPETTQPLISSLADKNLVSVDECIEAFHSETGRVVFVDATWFHKGDRNGRTEFENGPRIRGAKHFDMDDIAAKDTDLWHMLPTPELLSFYMEKYLGVTSQQDHIVIYASDGTVFTPRVWYTMHAMGHQQVHLMQGSLEEWIAAGGPVEDTPESVPYIEDIMKYHSNDTLQYMAHEPSNVVALTKVLELQKDPNVVILDPRGSSFAKQGHMPGAQHFPYASLLDPEQSLRLLPTSELKERLLKVLPIPFPKDGRVLTTCGSGVSVCHVILALQETGLVADDHVYMYDGSWNEYGAIEETPKVQ